jgi:hypothetical protein
MKTLTAPFLPILEEPGVTAGVIRRPLRQIGYRLKGRDLGGLGG